MSPERRKTHDFVSTRKIGSPLPIVDLAAVGFEIRDVRDPLEQQVVFVKYGIPGVSGAGLSDADFFRRLIKRRHGRESRKRIRDGYKQGLSAEVIERREARIADQIRREEERGEETERIVLDVINSHSGDEGVIRAWHPQKYGQRERRHGDVFVDLNTKVQGIVLGAVGIEVKSSDGGINFFLNEMQWQFNLSSRDDVLDKLIEEARIVLNGRKKPEDVWADFVAQMKAIQVYFAGEEEVGEQKAKFSQKLASELKVGRLDNETSDELQRLIQAEELSPTDIYILISSANVFSQLRLQALEYLADHPSEAQKVLSAFRTGSKKDDWDPANEYGSSRHGIRVQLRAKSLKQVISSDTMTGERAGDRARSRAYAQLILRLVRMGTKNENLVNEIVKLEEVLKQ